MRSAALAALGAGFLATASAHATIHNYVTNDPGLDGTTVNAAAGTVSFLQSSYDTVLQKFTWNVTFSDGVAKNTDGYWLVVSPGQMPLGTNGEFAIIYFDASSFGTPSATVYRYNGLNDASSYLNPADLLASSLTPAQTSIMVSTSQSAGARTFNLMVDATAINAAYSPPAFPLWQGLQFGPQIGIWFHPTSSTVTSYNNDRLSFFGHFGPGGWYDGTGIDTFIPSPGSAALLAVAGLVVGRRRRA
jgi:uncharacterized protein (TIGR03382 family)